MKFILKHLSTYFAPGTKDTKFKDPLTPGSSHSRTNKIIRAPNHPLCVHSKGQCCLQVSWWHSLCTWSRLSQLTARPKIPECSFYRQPSLYLSSRLLARAPCVTDEVTDYTSRKLTAPKCWGMAKNFIYIIHS